MKNKHTVLFVDDEERILSSIRRMLRKEPYNILTTVSGKQGLELMRKNDVDVVVADYHMPEMSGMEFLKTVRKEWPDTTRIMLTAHDLIEIASEAIEKGEVYRFITKPWDENEMKQTLEDAILAHNIGMVKKHEPRSQKKRLYTMQMIERLKKELVEGGHITGKRLEHAIDIRKHSTENLGTLLIKLNYITEDKLIDFISKHLNIPMVDIDVYDIAPSIIKLVPEKLARRYKLIPLFIEGKAITIAMADPSDLMTIGDIRSFLGKEINPMICSEVNIVKAINQYYSDEESPEEDLELSFLEEAGETAPGEEDTFSIETEEKTEAEMAKEPGVISLVNRIVSQAVDVGASDIHINPERDKMKIRLRIDGILFALKSQPKKLYLPVVSRLKIMSSLDISKKWIPQDGRIRIKIMGREIELRVSTYPTINGESIVMRILDKSRGLVDIPGLGFSSEDLKKFNEIITKTHGIFLVTGPTGSGKTTTLYSVINTLDAKRKNIITIEEPVEYELRDISQGEIHEKKGFGFAHAMRSILRHDPDVIFVGEIRDGETAQMAFRAAMTGHFVLSTLHTNNAVGAVMRLIDIGVEPFLIASSLRAVLGQRLVRKICLACKEKYVPAHGLLKRLNIPVGPGRKFYKGKGCSECKGTGYSGRIGIFEIFQVSRKIGEMISKNKPESEIYAAAVGEGMIPLDIDGLGKVEKGLTTLEEVMGVL